MIFIKAELPENMLIEEKVNVIVLNGAKLQKIDLGKQMIMFLALDFYSVSLKLIHI